jgi:hypothetical protein
MKSKTVQLPQRRMIPLILNVFGLSLLSCLVGCSHSEPAETERTEQAEINLDTALEWGTVRIIPLGEFATAVNNFLSRRTPDGTQEVRFVDATFGLGVRAWIRPPEGDWLLTERNGTLALPDELRDSELRVHAYGYHDALIESGTLQASTELEPLCTTTVRLLDENGRGVPDAEVHGESVYEEADLYEDTTPYIAPRWVWSATDSDGRETYQTGHGIRAWIKNGDFLPRGIQAPVLPPCGTRDLELPAAGREPRLSLLSGAKSGPYCKAELRISWPGDRFAFDLDRGPTGATSVHADYTEGARFINCSGALQVDLDDGTCWLAEDLGSDWERLSPSSARFLGEVTRGQAAEDEPARITLDVAPKPVTFALAEVGAEYSLFAELRYGFESAAVSDRVAPYQFERIQTSWGFFWSPDLDVAARMRGGETLVLWPVGYHPVRLSSLEGRIDEYGRCRVEFERAKMRKLCVLDRDGRALNLRVVIKRASDGTVVREAITRRDLYSDFDWTGGDLVVLAEFPEPYAPDQQPVVIARLSEALLESAECFEITLGTRAATVEVFAARGRTSELVLIDQAGHEHFPVSRDVNRVRFDPVPQGHFIVGPKRWVRQLHDRRTPASIAAEDFARPGAVTKVQWDSNWIADQARSGKLEVTAGNSPLLFLVDAYATTDRELPLDKDTSWRTIDVSGHYTVHEHEPLPRALLVCSIAEYDGAFVVHDVVYPGNDVKLEFGEVELNWDSDSWIGPVVVSWTLPRELDADLVGQLVPDGEGRTDAIVWSTADQRVLHHVPPVVESLRFRAGGTSWQQAIEVVAGERRVMRVQAPEAATDK